MRPSRNEERFRSLACKVSRPGTRVSVIKRWLTAEKRKREAEAVGAVATKSREEGRR